MSDVSETIFIPLSEMSDKASLLAGKKVENVTVTPGLGNTYTVIPITSGRVGGQGGRLGRSHAKQIRAQKNAPRIRGIEICRSGGTGRGPVEPISVPKKRKTSSKKGK